MWQDFQWYYSWRYDRYHDKPLVEESTTASKVRHLRRVPAPRTPAVRAVALILCFFVVPGIFGMNKWLSRERLGNSEIRPPH